MNLENEKGRMKNEGTFRCFAVFFVISAFCSLDPVFKMSFTVPFPPLNCLREK